MTGNLDRERGDLVNAGVSVRENGMAKVGSFPFVSVIMPVYNAEPFIARTLDSALDQTYSNIEIIIVDDGSTDTTSDICQHYASRNACIRYIRTVNRGVAHARNHGTGMASGDYVAFLDADDLWHPTKISRQVAAMTGMEGRSYLASFTLHRTIDLSDRVRGTVKYHPSPDTSLVFDYSRFAEDRPVGNGSSIMVLRTVMQEIGGYDPSFVLEKSGGCEDLDVEMKIVCKYNFVCVPEYLVGYRVYRGSMASNHRQMARSMALIVARHFESSPLLTGKSRRVAMGKAYCYVMDKMFAGADFRQAAMYFAWAVVRVPSMALRYLLYYWPLALARKAHLLREKSMAESDWPLYLDLDPSIPGDRQPRRGSDDGMSRPADTPLAELA